MVTVALPEGSGLRGGGARVRRFRSHVVEPGARLRDFRRRYGLRWLELAHGVRLDPHRSLAAQVPPGLLDGAAGAASEL